MKDRLVGRVCSLLAVAGMLICLGCEVKHQGNDITERSPTTNPSEFEHVDQAKLLASFADTFGADFDVVSSRFAHDRSNEPWMLVSVRPRRSGHFVIRYDMEQSPDQYSPEGETWVCEYHFMVGTKGQRRKCTTRYAWPLACVSDVIVIPIRVARVFSNHRFFAHGVNERYDASWAKEDREEAEGDPLAQYKQDVTIQNNVSDSLTLLGSGAKTMAHRPKDRYGHDLVGVFEARKAGCFNTRLAPEKDEYGQQAYPHALAIVPEGDPLCVLAVRCHETRTDGAHRVSDGPSWEWDTVPLRAGDRLIVGYGYTDARQDPPSHPHLRLTREPFQPGGWAPFQIEATAAGR